MAKTVNQSGDIQPEKVRKWLESGEGQKALSEIAKRAKSEDDEMKKAQRIELSPFLHRMR